MPWTPERYPTSMRHLSPEVRTKAVEIANALLKEGMSEGQAIPHCDREGPRLVRGTSRAGRDRTLGVDTLTGLARRPALVDGPGPLHGEQRPRRKWP